MAYRLVGYMPKISVADNGAGAVRITFAPGVFSPSHHDRTLTDGTWYAANQTTAVSAAITAKGGSKREGFWFDLGGVAHPSANWNANDRVGTQGDVAINSYATSALARAASATHDTLIWGFADVNDSLIWDGLISNGAPFISAIGMVDGLVVTRGGWFGNGDMSAQVNQLIYDNFHIADLDPTATATAIGHALYYAGNAGFYGAGIKVTRVTATGGFIAFRAQGANLNSVLIENCMAWFYDRAGVYFDTQPHTVRNCTMVGSGAGCAGFEFNNRACFCENNVAHNNGLGDFYENALLASFVKCASGDATGSEVALQNLTKEQFAWWRDHDGRHFYPNFRIRRTSALFRAGAVGAPPYDVDWCVRNAAAPSIGAHEGTMAAYGGDPQSWGAGEVSGIN